MPNFSTADKVSDVVTQMQNVEVVRASQRALLNDFYNGKPIWTEKEQKENRIQIAFNDKSGAVLLHNARAQYENAFLRQENYFKISVPNAPAKAQKDLATQLTSLVNRPIKASRPFYHIQQSVFGGVTLHGVGAKIWWDGMAWKPAFAAMQDILIPTDTELTMEEEDLQFFAVRRKLRPGQLFKFTFFRKKENIDPGWNLDATRILLGEYKELNTNPQNYDWAFNPEQMGELYKQNLAFYENDAAPVIWCWDFFHREEQSRNPGWYRKIILDKDSIPQTLATAGKANVFLYSEKKPFASALNSIIHFQFGDGNNVPPFMYQSIRSLAFLTYELLWTMNRLRCQFTQHVFEQMLTLFKINDPSDRARLEQVVFEAPWGMIPEGLQMITSDQRYQVNAQLVEGLSRQYQQLVAQSTQAYTQNFGQQTQGRERVTKFELMQLMQQTSQLMQTLINNAYRQETFCAREIARRFTLKNSTDFDVKKFQNKAKEAGIDRRWLDVDEWDIEIEQVLGGGNRSMELAESQALLEMAPMLDPSAQQEVKHSRVLAITNNAKLASRLAPMDAHAGPSDAVKQGEADFAFAMQGGEPSVKEGLNHVEQAGVLLTSMARKIGQINKTGGVGTPQDIIGLQSAAQHVAKHIQILGQDPNEKQKVKEFGDALGKLMNQVKAFAQRQQQAQGQQNGNGESQAPELIKAVTKAKINEASARQKMKHKDMAFEGDQRRKNLETVADIQRENLKGFRSLSE
jgi:hypothetical protein